MNNALEKQYIQTTVYPRRKFIVFVFLVKVVIININLSMDYDSHAIRQHDSHIMSKQDSFPCHQHRLEHHAVPVLRVQGHLSITN